MTAKRRRETRAAGTIDQSRHREARRAVAIQGFASVAAEGPVDASKTRQDPGLPRRLCLLAMTAKRRLEARAAGTIHRSRHREARRAVAIQGFASVAGEGPVDSSTTGKGPGLPRRLCLLAMTPNRRRETRAAVAIHKSRHREARRAVAIQKAKKSQETRLLRVARNDGFRDLCRASLIDEGNKSIPATVISGAKTKSTEQVPFAGGRPRKPT
jgi:hypothetical protein